MLLPVIDTHVHLFATPHLDNLAWMTPDNKLYCDCRLEEYLANNFEKLELKGLIFIETDVKNDLDNPESGYELAVQEYLWIERIISGKLLEGEGSTLKGDLIKAIIPWAPVPNGALELKRYIDLLKEKSHSELAFNRIKGIRYLVQDKPPKTMLKASFIEGLNWLGSQNLVFDLGIDTRSGGNWQVEEFIELISRTKNVTYIINHLTKPDLQIAPNLLESNDKFAEWKSLMRRVSGNKNNSFFIKLSGGFSELPVDVTDDIEECVNRIFPWFEFLLKEFGEDNLIWGSDWPVSTLNGGKDALHKWSAISFRLFERLGLKAEKILYHNSINAYNLDL